MYSILSAFRLLNLDIVHLYRILFCCISCHGVLANSSFFLYFLLGGRILPACPSAPPYRPTNLCYRTCCDSSPGLLFFRGPPQQARGPPPTFNGFPPLTHNSHAPYARDKQGGRITWHTACLSSTLHVPTGHTSTRIRK